MNNVEFRKQPNGNWRVFAVYDDDDDNDDAAAAASG